MSNWIEPHYVYVVFKKRNTSAFAQRICTITARTAYEAKDKFCNYNNITNRNDYYVRQLNNC